MAALDSHVRDSAGSVVSIVSESTVDQPTLYPTAVYGGTFYGITDSSSIHAVLVESKNGSANSTSPTSLQASGVSLLTSTVTSTGWFVMAAPTSGIQKRLVGVGIASTYPAYVYTASTGVLIISTGGTSNRCVKLANAGDYATLAAIGSSAYVLISRSGGTTLTTT